MTLLPSRYSGPPVALAEGWTCERLTRPSRLAGANGIRTGADGRIYVASVPSSSVTAINPDTGTIETISPLGGTIVAPDDLVFDEAGNLYLTEITEGRVCMREPNGRVRVIPNGPRTLDLDIVLYGEQEIDEPGLKVPHPRAHERAFVLVPLVDVWPEATIPGKGAARDWLRRVTR